MSATMNAQHIAVSIERDWQAVAAYLAEPANFNHWAAGLGQSLHQENGEWVGLGPAGPIRLRFSPPNAYGVADHWVEVAPGTLVYVPLRVLANGSGAEVVLTLFRLPDMDDARFAADADWVRQDLVSLKQVLEA